MPLRALGADIDRLVANDPYRRALTHLVFEPNSHGATCFGTDLSVTITSPCTVPKLPTEPPRPDH